jgi:hypothetical protein
MRRPSRLPLAVGLDVFSVVLFVALGRRNHDEDGTLSSVIGTAAPFLIGLAVGWVAARAWRRPDAFATGAAVWVATVVVGMTVRNLVFDRGTAASFVAVATAFVGVFLLGWRAVLAVAARRQTPA